MTKLRILTLAALSCLILTGNNSRLAAQTVTVKDTLMRTYPYSDPNPVPQTDKIYPYWHFSGFTGQAEDRVWKMVVLENDYLRVKVFPEVGGKVWSIFDKTTGKEMFYDNDVVKFREIALRGPWTSGGIEFNYGVIGHAPSCSAPVDWKTETKADGSVSCYIGVFEMLSRSHWTVEINLPKDAVRVRTTSTWHNDSAEYQPYYSWANSAVKSADDLVLVYPSDNAIGHDGEALAYPVDEQGRDLSLYNVQTFGHGKSYHMVGSHKPFFGAYYSSEDWGVMHWSLRDEKLGRKYFTWAQSREGGIWVNLLTDTRPQYVEMQSGKLFNQNVVGSSLSSSYRQVRFTPFGTDEWSDYWLPYGGIGPADNVTLDAVTSVRKDGRHSAVGIYPLIPLCGDVTVLDAEGKVLMQDRCSLSPAKAVSFKVKGEPAAVAVGGKTLWRAESEITDRPQERNGEFDPQSASALMMMARDYSGMRMYKAAEDSVDRVLAMEPSRIEALALKAELLYRKARYQEAYEMSGKALAIDQYNPDAGYIGGLAAVELGRYADAMDRFEVSSIGNSPLRTSAFTELARLHFTRGDRDLAADYARKAILCNGHNTTAMKILYKVTGEGLDDIRTINPLDHFPDAELLLSGKMDAAAFAATFQEEIAWEDYLETALFYQSLGLDRDALAILDAMPEKNALCSIWAAYIRGDRKAVAAAEKDGVEYVFPFRRESLKALQWAVDNGGKWQSRYLLAMLQDFLGDREAAAALLSDNGSRYAPYYAYRYRFSEDSDDLKRAVSLDPQGWRYRKMLAADMVENGQVAEAAAMLEDFYAGHRDKVQIGDALIDAYLAADMFEKAEKIIDTIEYLPFEGLRGSHDKYRHIKLHLAAAAADSGDLAKAEKLLDEALLWPERLGVGKPYDELIDTSAEDWLRKEIDARKSTDGPFEPLSPRLKTSLRKDRKLF